MTREVDMWHVYVASYPACNTVKHGKAWVRGYVYVRWYKGIPDANDLIHAACDDCVVLGAIVYGRYPLGNTKHSLIFSSL